MHMAKTKAPLRSKGKNAAIGISREVWEWARANPRYESLMEELEDLEDLRREKAKAEKGVQLGDHSFRHQDAVIQFLEE
jgi:hypothetical protein